MAKMDESLEKETHRRLESTVGRLSGIFTAEELGNPRFCALACAMGMQLFLAMAKLSKAERDEFFGEVLPGLGRGWTFSCEEDADWEGDVIKIKLQPKDESPSKLVH